MLGWDGDIRRYLCVAWAVDENDRNVDVVGSFLDEWQLAPEQFEA